MDWIEQLLSTFSEVSAESGLRMGYDTHYDARNFVFSTVKGNDIHHIDFQPMENGTIQITKLTYKYPAFPKLFRFLHNTVPMFPFVAKVNYEKIGILSPPFEGLDFKNTVHEAVKNAL